MLVQLNPNGDTLSSSVRIMLEKKEVALAAADARFAMTR